MTQAYSPEVRDALIHQIQKLQDIAGYHFDWCNKCECDCGMRQLRTAKYRLQNQQLSEFELWQDALGD